MFYDELSALLDYLRGHFEGKPFDYSVTVIESFYWLKSAIDEGSYPVSNLTAIWIDLTLGNYELGFSRTHGYSVFNCDTGEVFHGN